MQTAKRFCAFDDSLMAAPNIETDASGASSAENFCSMRCETEGLMSALFYCVAVGIFWGVATLVARYLSVGTSMMAILISAGQFLAMAPLIPSQSFAAAGATTLGIGIAAGLINGLGLLAYYQLVAGANDGLWELSRVAPIAMVL